MAGCFQDQEEFESDLTIEIAREGDILKEGQILKRKRCTKNPGHQDFIPFKDLTLEHLPYGYKNTKTLDYIKQRGSRVVRLVVGRNLGSGCVHRVNNQYCIRTNYHVVNSAVDLKHCKVEFHYDDDSRSSVITSRGVELTHTDSYRDVTLFKFHPVPEFLHQQHYGDKRDPYINIMLKNNQIQSKLALSSPSDWYFSLLNLNSSDNYLMFISYPDGFIGYINSCYFKFQPMPSNIQELTSVEVYIDLDNGKRRKIRGDVVKFGDDVVIKVSDSITQDKVKKYRVVRNGEVIGRGTRLYFKQCKYKDFFNMRGIDKDWGDTDVWEFNFHPNKVSEDRIESDDLCCIGHPHGAIKHITFGRQLGESLEKFDNQLRHIKDPQSDCQCKEVCCLNYSCKTCPGSSGSPVFNLWDLDSDSYFTHFMGERVNRVINGEQIENINRAWVPVVELNRNKEREKAINQLKQVIREFKAKIAGATASTSNSSGEESNEVTINLLKQAMRQLEAVIARATALTSNSSGEGSNSITINLLEQAVRELETEIAGATALTSNSSGEGSNEVRQNNMAVLRRLISILIEKKG